MAGSSAGSAKAYVAAPDVPAGSTVTFRVWIPVDSRLSAVQPYVQEGAGGKWRWTGTWTPVSALTAGAWNALSVQVPTRAAALHQLGVQIYTDAAWSGTCYVDSVEW